MYCSSCGVAVGQSLSYCNYCGAKLSDAKGDQVTDPSAVKKELLVSAMVAVFVLGLLAITILLGVMKSVLALNVGQILPFAVLSFLILLLIEGVIIRLLFQSTRGAAQAADKTQLKGQATKELDATQPRELPEGVPSVTEHTTRVLDPIYSERSSK